MPFCWLLFDYKKISIRYFVILFFVIHTVAQGFTLFCSHSTGFYPVLICCAPLGLVLPRQRQP
jgi:hypothetical protein